MTSSLRYSIVKRHCCGRVFDPYCKNFGHPLVKGIVAEKRTNSQGNEAHIVKSLGMSYWLNGHFATS